MSELKPRKGQEGGVLVISLLLLMGLTALGAAFMTTSRTEVQISGNVITYAQALSHAEAGLNEAVARLAVPSSPHYVAEDMTAPNPGWGRYIVLEKGNSTQDPDFGKTATDGLDNDLDAATDEASESYPEVLSVQSDFHDPLAYPWIKVNYCLDGGNNIVRYGDHDNNRATPPRRNSTFGQPIVTVTARGEQGPANRTLEVDLVRPPAFDIRACIYTEDDDFLFGGNSFLVSGQDFDPATGDTVPGSTRLPAIITTADVDKLIASVGHQEADQIIGSGGEPDVQAAPEDLNLEWYVDTWGRLADFHYVGDTKNLDNVNVWGDFGDYCVVYVEDGDLTLKGDSMGGGLMMVDGNLKVAGSFTWYGVVIVLGDIYFKGGGSGIHIYGGVFSNGVNLNTVVGTADIMYSSEAIDRLKSLRGVLPLSWKER